jgi:DtxR family Mn-dependent transcriptional regulator
MLSIVEENYIKNIYLLSENSDNNIVKTNDIAYKLNYSAASVTDMVKKLSHKKLIKYKPYYGAELTKKGRSIALNIVRKHRLWELFLTKTLGFTWDKVHDIAEQLEHVQSEELINSIDKFLNYPKFDPHGDPIPNANGVVAEIKVISLLNCDKHKKYKLVSFNNHSTAFLNYMKKIDLSLNNIFTIIDFEEFDNSVLIKNKFQKDIYISAEAAKCLFVSQIK